MFTIKFQYDKKYRKLFHYCIIEDKYFEFLNKYS